MLSQQMNIFDCQVLRGGNRLGPFVQCLAPGCRLRNFDQAEAPIPQKDAEVRPSAAWILERLSPAGRA